jgi:tRNA G18 (ribose-2'-O)-methylase SpoU
MKLQEHHWTCECGTTIRYANTHRITVHLQSKKHQQFLIHHTVFVQKYIQRSRKPTEIVFQKTKSQEPAENTRTAL